MLRAGAATVAGMAVGGVVGAPSADAAAGDSLILGVPNDGGAAKTDLTSTSASGVFHVTSGAAGAAVRATGVPVPAGGAVSAAGNGTALAVEGKLTLARSGAVTTTQQSVTVPVPGGLTASSQVLATLQSPVPSPSNWYAFGLWVQAAKPNPTDGTITIWLSQTPAVSARIAWLVFG